MILISKKLINIFFLFTIVITVSCADDFNTAIKSENETTEDSSLPSIYFESSSSYTINENETPHQINILISKASDKKISVVLKDTANGSAIIGTDYTLTGWDSPETVIFSPGETVKSVNITPLQDSEIETEDETIILEITLPVNGIINSSSHIVTITDDDGWIKLGEVATPRAGAAIALEGDWLYIYGGETYSDVAIDDFWRYNLSNGDYEILTSNGERAYATLLNLNGELYRFGGKDTAGNVYDRENVGNGIYFYDTSTSTWHSFDTSDTNGSWPVERSHHIAVPVYESGSIESVYFNGGKNSAGINVSGEMFEIDFTASPKYDWIDYTISHSRSEHSAVFYNDSIYLFGGYNSGTYYNDLWEFDTTNSNFSEISITGITIIPTRSGISMIEHDGLFYVFGGFDGTDCLDDLWYYSSGSWTKISTAPVKRAFYSAVEYDDSLIIFGGYSLNASSQKVYSSEIWKYDLE
ncbi:MAG: hypothetical protein JW864_12980 [Spirochaetes bacterium]|nr:hypothetical protein [Spirochaetota bacterium]